MNIPHLPPEHERIKLAHLRGFEDAMEGIENQQHTYLKHEEEEMIAYGQGFEQGLQERKEIDEDNS